MRKNNVDIKIYVRYNVHKGRWRYYDKYKCYKFKKKFVFIFRFYYWIQWYYKCKYKKGNVIIISESEYNGLLETLYLLSDPTMKEKLEAAKNATDDDYEVFEW